MLQRQFKNIYTYGGLVRFTHSLFMLPFAGSALILAHSQGFSLSLWSLAWIVLALLSGRTAAMTMNRIADVGYDALNPRTKSRHMVTGEVGSKQAKRLVFLSCLGLLLAAAMLNTLCLVFAPLGIVWILGYSYSKRFTPLCHLWLGTACAIGAMGSWMAVTANLDLRAMLLTGACSLWVAGFDIIYACQDLEFDRRHNLQSLPAWLGTSKALTAVRLLFCGSWGGFALTGLLFGLGWLYYAGLLVIAAILIAWQVMAAKKPELIAQAFFTMNWSVSMVYFCFLLLDRWLTPAALLPAPFPGVYLGLV